MGSRNFHFKQFSISDAESAMKINSDSVLLGIWIKENVKRVLDIGTGCGVLAFILAFKSSATFDAIDIDAGSCQQAEKNVNSLNLRGRIRIVNLSLQDYVKSSREKYDLIVCNPPFFIDSQRSPDKSRNISKHNQNLGFDELTDGVAKLLNKDGKFYTIIAYNSFEKLKEAACLVSLGIEKLLLIKPKPDKVYSRVLACFSFNADKSIRKEELIIRNIDNNFTEAYKAFVKNYYEKEF
ncbi:MAG: methyltransferase [Bacteroidales bacterium]|nr:methyltransferase [Bacteroidales bacterium]